MTRTTAERRRFARAAAVPFGGVLSRRRLRSLGIDARMILREVRAERWRTWGRQTVALHTGELDVLASRWRAVWEVGERIAVLDGVSSLDAAGMVGFKESDMHVSVRHSHDVEPVEGVRIHKVIRRVHGEVITTGIPRTIPEVAAIRAAHWATSDRQAALVLCMPVQQRLLTGDDLVDASRRVRGRTRRRFIRLVAADIADGAHSLGELDFAGACRARGLPEPDRQASRRGPRGAVYLDARWSNGLVVEIDGAAHRWGLAVADDNLRANGVSLQRDLVLRIDLVGWRLAEAAYMDQVCAGYWLCERGAVTGRGDGAPPQGLRLPRTG
jgi:hypothetical protein